MQIQILKESKDPIVKLRPSAYNLKATIEAIEFQEKRGKDARKQSSALSRYIVTTIDHLLRVIPMRMTLRKNLFLLMADIDSEMDCDKGEARDPSYSPSSSKRKSSSSSHGQKKKARTNGMQAQESTMHTVARQSLLDLIATFEKVEQLNASSLDHQRVACQYAQKLAECGMEIGCYDQFEPLHAYISENLCA